MVCNIYEQYHMVGKHIWLPGCCKVFILLK